MFADLLSGTSLGVALAWAGYFAAHSWLASRTMKTWAARRWPGRERGYRLAYNLLAVALLAPVLALTELASDDWLWRWEGAWAWVAHATTVLVFIGFLRSSRVYDMREFLGLAPRTAPRLGLSQLHRFVRHPWYFLGLLWIWTRDMDVGRLIAVLAITAYLWIGSRLEERKLIAELGEELGPIYRAYRARVPGLIPRPWRHLSREEWIRLNDAGQRRPSSASMT